VATRKTKLTWDKAGLRWKKIHKGRRWYGKRGGKKSDDEAYRQALADFEQWRGGVDLQLVKPNAEQYEQAISIRDEMVRICLLEGETEDHERLAKEIAWLKKNYARTNPPKLTWDSPVVPDPLSNASVPERIKWYDRIDALRLQDKWIQPAEKDKTLSKNIEKFNSSRKSRVEAGQLAAKSYHSCAERLKAFLDFVGDMPIDRFNGVHLSAYFDHLMKMVKEKKYSVATAKGYFVAVKSFVNWLYDEEIIDTIPRIMRKLSFKLETKAVKTLSIQEVKQLLAAAKGKIRLYILLMLNCGFTQIDIGELSSEEIKNGRIIRKRSKTKAKENVPLVNYLLWKETASLLEQYRQKQGDRALLNARGKPVRELSLKGDKLHTNDSVRNSLVVLCNKANIPCPPPKLFRKTSASLLYNNPAYRSLHQLFLGHSANSVAEKNYLKPDDTILDEAIRFLGEQYGIA
jgi:integrase